MGPTFGEPMPESSNTAPAPVRSWICPECQAGKHRNCDGNAWDMLHDCFTPCACHCRRDPQPRQGHGRHRAPGPAQ